MCLVLNKPRAGGNEWPRCYEIAEAEYLFAIRTQPLNERGEVTVGGNETESAYFLGVEQVRLRPVSISPADVDHAMGGELGKNELDLSSGRIVPRLPEQARARWSGALQAP